MKFCAHEYVTNKQGITLKNSIFVALLTNPNDLLERNNNRLIAALEASGLADKIGLYFYRFRNLDKYGVFSKIGEVTRVEGISQRVKKGWHTNGGNADTYLKRPLHSKVQEISSENPMYFVFYDQNSDYSYPKIDESHAFEQHRIRLGVETPNAERPNRNTKVGAKLRWRESTFDEVYRLQFPDGSSYGSHPEMDMNDGDPVVQAAIQWLRDTLANGANKAEATRQLRIHHPGLTRSNCMRILMQGADMRDRMANTYWHRYYVKNVGA